MAELSAVDVEQYTNGMLTADNPETKRMLDTALAVARADVRWHVSPVILNETIILHGTSCPYLRLPTRKVIALHSITNDGATVDPVNDVVLDQESGNLLILNTGIWSHKPNGVVIMWDHGFPEDATAAAAIPGYTGPLATDWRQAVLSLVTNLAQISIVGRSDYELNSKQIDDVVYRWAANPALGSVEPILAKYRLLWKWI